MKINNKHAMYYSTLYCQICGLKMVIPRKLAHKRPIGHIKTMYCSTCQQKTNFIEEPEHPFNQ